MHIVVPIFRPSGSDGVAFNGAALDDASLVVVAIAVAAVYQGVGFEGEGDLGAGDGRFRWSGGGGGVSRVPAVRDRGG